MSVRQAGTMVVVPRNVLILMVVTSVSVEMATPWKMGSRARLIVSDCLDNIFASKWRIRFVWNSALRLSALVMAVSQPLIVWTGGGWGGDFRWICGRVKELGIAFINSDLKSVLVLWRAPFSSTASGLLFGGDLSSLNRWLLTKYCYVVWLLVYPSSVFLRRSIFILSYLP